MVDRTSIMTATAAVAVPHPPPPGMGMRAPVELTLAVLRGPVERRVQAAAVYVLPRPPRGFPPIAAHGVRMKTYDINK